MLNLHKAGPRSYTFEDFAMSSRRPQVGDVVSTQAIGRRGHNYLHLRVLSVSEPTGGKVRYAATPCHLDGRATDEPG